MILTLVWRDKAELLKFVVSIVAFMVQIFEQINYH